MCPQMSQQNSDRVLRVRASRQRRATNALLHASPMRIDSPILPLHQPARIDRPKRARSLMDFTPELTKVNRQRRCLLRSKMPPLPSAENTNGMLESNFLSMFHWFL